MKRKRERGRKRGKGGKKEKQGTRRRREGLKCKFFLPEKLRSVKFLPKGGTVREED